jgi:hypothetical protein
MAEKLALMYDPKQSWIMQKDTIKKKPPILSPKIVIRTSTPAPIISRYMPF